MITPQDHKNKNRTSSTRNLESSSKTLTKSYVRVMNRAMVNVQRRIVGDLQDTQVPWESTAIRSLYQRCINGTQTSNWHALWKFEIHESLKKKQSMAGIIGGSGSTVKW